MASADGGADAAAAPSVTFEDDPEWGKQHTVANPERLGVNGAEVGSEQAEDDAIRRSKWTRQNSSPGERPFDRNSPPKEGGGGGQGRGGPRGRRGGAQAPVWYYKDWSGEHGPKSLAQLTQALQKGYFSPTTLVRKEGQDRWSTLRDVLDLRHALRARRMASFKDEMQRKKGGGLGRQHSLNKDGSSKGPAGKEKDKGGAGMAAAATPRSEVDDALITQLFKSGGPDWFYIDMQGAVQGPFKASRMAKWWSNPQYRDHFSTLLCRRGPQGDFKPLSAFSPLSEQPPNESKGSTIAGGSRNRDQSREQHRATQAAKKVQAAEEMVKQLQERVEELELENEQLRQSNEDTFMLRMQVEQLFKDKAALAAEVSQLKRDKEGLQELLQYAKQFEADVDEELLLEEGEGGGTQYEEDDEATMLWLEELRRNQSKSPGHGQQ